MRERIKNYFKKRSKLNLFGDAVFAILIILLIIPGPRNVIMSNVIRLVSTQPSKVKSTPISLTAPDYVWTFRDNAGVVKNFGELKGKVIFLNHWATWCPHCVAEMPDISKLYDDYKDDVVFLLMTHEDPKVVSDFLIQRDLRIPFHHPLQAVPKIIDTRSLPRTYIIGKDGRIYVDKTGAAKWNGKKTRGLLDELIAM